MPDPASRIKIYRRSVRASFFLVLFLVLVGGIVRTTGSGMGCPDWPKCFGSWIPPTSVDQVPVSYYSNPLSSKDGVLVFNVNKTWTEYVNRLIGVFIGLALMLQLFWAFRSGSPSRSKFFSFLAFLLVLFQGWLGAKVVSSDLLPVVITIHLVGALLIAFCLVVALHFSDPLKQIEFPTGFHVLPVLVFLVLLIQFFLGTQVRGQVDVLFKKFDFGQRWLYVEHLDLWFYIHRSFSILVLVLLLFQFLSLRRLNPVIRVGYLLSPLIIGLALVISGIALVYFGFPAFAQPIHLTLGFAVMCSQFWILLRLHSFSKTLYVSG